jgi:hypothetical protein
VIVGFLVAAGATCLGAVIGWSSYWGLISQQERILKVFEIVLPIAGARIVGFLYFTLVKESPPTDLISVKECLPEWWLYALGLFIGMLSAKLANVVGRRARDL